MNNYFASNLKYLREKKRLSQQELAEELEVPQPTLACWENGIRTPKISQVQVIADYFNVGMDIISHDYSNNETDLSRNEFDILFDKYKEVLSEDDKDMIKFIIEKRKKEIDEQNHNS